MSAELIKDMIISRFSNEVLDQLDDSAVLPSLSGRLAFTSDSFVVAPTFFPGGNIGDLAVCGTVNDLAMSGADPKYLSLALIIEEGFEIEKLALVLDSVKARTEQAGVTIVTGDTKVVGRGQGDGIFINTTGIGVIPDGVDISSHNAKPGDAVLVSGAVGLHGLAVMLARSDFNMTSPVESDVAPLNKIIKTLIDNNININVLRDPTRGGLATALNDIASNSNATIEIHQDKVPVTEAQSGACDILGLDYLQSASEGRVIAIVDSQDADKAVEIMKQFDDSKEATIIGSVIEKDKYPLELVTSIGSRRVITIPRGEQMPRIC